VKLKIGDVVAYPPHGVGRIAAREKRVVLGTKQEVVVLALDDDLSVTLTLDRAQEQLRPLVDEEGLRRVQETLRADGVFSDEIWAKRLKDAQAKLRSGDPLELAEIVRDGARREHRLTTTGYSKLSVSERALWVKARDLLSGEIGLVRGVDRAEASAWIDEQLAPLVR
jgi:CarD family transcriptional regulator